MTIQRIW